MRRQNSSCCAEVYPRTPVLCLVHQTQRSKLAQDFNINNALSILVWSFVFYYTSRKSFRILHGWLFEAHIQKHPQKDL